MQNEYEKLLQKIWKIRKPEGKIPDGKININFTLSPQEYKEEDQFLVAHIDKTSEWKCLYRLELKSKIYYFRILNKFICFTKGSKTETPDSEPIPLSLFALVQNPTSEDWSNVSISFIANELELIKDKKPLVPPITAAQSKSFSGVKGGMQVFVKTLTGQ